MTLRQITVFAKKKMVMFRLVVRLLMSYLHMQFSGELPRKTIIWQIKPSLLSVKDKIYPLSVEKLYF